MVEMKIEELISQLSVCGVWVKSIKPLSIDRLSALMRKIPETKYIGYCLTDRESVSLGIFLEEFKTIFPAYRIIVIGNPNWYSCFSLEIQNLIIQRLEQADIFIRCTFPMKDAYQYLILCSEQLLVQQPRKQNTLILRSNKHMIPSK